MFPINSSYHFGQVAKKPFILKGNIKPKQKKEEESPHPLLDELRKTAPHSFLEFIKHVKILGDARFGKSSGIQTFKLHQEQKELFDIMMKQYDSEYDWQIENLDGSFSTIKGKRQFVRLGVAKARQVGTSTFFAIFWLYVCFVMEKNLAVVNSTTDKNKSLHKKLTLAFESLPVSIRGGYGWSGSGEKEIKFNIFKRNNPYVSSRSVVFVSADTEGGLRSGTYKGILFTECGFYAQSRNLDLQSVALEKDTFIIFESTPWGQGNLLYDVYVLACKNKSGFSNMEMIFQKWWANPKYRITPPNDYKPHGRILEYLIRYKFKASESVEVTEEEKQLYKAEGLELLSLSQVFWIEYTLSNSPDIATIEDFNKAYPPSLEACFTSSVTNCFCDVNLAEKAINLGRNSNNMIKSSINYPVFIGVDIAFRRDKTAIAVRKGPNVLAIEYVNFEDKVVLELGAEVKEVQKRHVLIAEKIFEIADDLASKGEIISRISIDCSNDASVVSELQDILKNAQKEKRHYERVSPYCVCPVHFAATIEAEGHSKKIPVREYIYFKFANWLEYNRIKGAYIQYNPELLDQIKATLVYMGSQGERKIIEKIKIQKSLGGKSPDALDAVVLTMYKDDFFGIKVVENKMDPNYKAPKLTY